eukprot:m.135128 g.135128  ORF g.135128 m.135128 type:complete len:78 (+) comp29779_c0_seq2:574-807(+)
MMESSPKKDVLLTDAQTKILYELRLIKAASQTLNAEFEKLITTTSPGGNFHERQKKAAVSLSLWENLPAKVDNESTQ